MVLVTGATGLVGSHLLLHLLESGNTGIRAIYRTEHGKERVRMLFKMYRKEPLFAAIEWVLADITDVPSLESAFANINFAYHCAAYISFDPKDEEKLRKTNIEGTANIVNFCLEYNVQKLCYVSSIATLGDLKEHETLITEETEWNAEKPHSDYAISKFGAEMEIWRGFQEGLEVVVVNPGVIIGASPDMAGWKNGSSEIFTRVAGGLPFYTKGSTGFVSVIDVVKIMVLLMSSTINGERFILVSENISFENILKTIAKALKVKAPYIYANRWITGIGWRFDWILAVFFGQNRKLSKAMAQALHSSQPISNRKIRLKINYEFESITPEINRIVSFFPKK